MKRIIYKNQDSSVSILIPTDEALSFATVIQVAEKDVPAGKPYKIVDVSEIPTDRSQRNAWTVDDAELTDGVGAVWNTFDEVQP